MASRLEQPFPSGMQPPPILPDQHSEPMITPGNKHTGGHLQTVYPPPFPSSLPPPPGFPAQQPLNQPYYEPYYEPPPQHTMMGVPIPFVDNENEREMHASKFVLIALLPTMPAGSFSCKRLLLLQPLPEFIYAGQGERGGTICGAILFVLVGGQ